MIQLVMNLKRMKYIFTSSIFFLLILTCCTSEERVVREGRVIYSIDYPNHKDNFFLYSILPKEMELNFKGDKMESRIEKANLKNVLLVDCNKKSVAAYFQYGEDACNVELNVTDIEEMLNDQKKYTIRFTSEKDTMAGFNVKKAIATAVEDPSDKITLWYTSEIEVKNSNWYNPFKEVPGFLLAYSIDRYGIRMEFKAERFEDIEIPDESLKLNKTGKRIQYSEYNTILGELFQSFE